MRVLVMGNNDHMGGLIVHYIILSKYLRKAGHDILCINVNDTGATLFNDVNVEEIVISYKPASVLQKAKKYIQLRKAIKAAKAFKPDIFIATGYGHGYAMVATALPRSAFKLFEEVHFEPHGVPLKLKMVDCFDAVAPQTQGMIEIFKKNISTKKLVAYLPCFSKEYNVPGFQKIPSVQSGIRLAYFGRLAGNKGIRQFVSATYELFQNDQLLLDIYGKGPEGVTIQEEIDNRGIQSKINLKGFYEDAEFPALISSYHGIIIPSLDTEGLPLILIEAMRFGRPVLCTTTGAMPEVGMINKEGMVVSEKEPQYLRNNLNLFVEKIRNNNFSAGSIHTIYKDHFSNEAFWQVWEQMLNDPKTYFAKKIS